MFVQNILGFLDSVHVIIGELASGRGVVHHDHKAPGHQFRTVEQLWGIILFRKETMCLCIVARREPDKKLLASGIP